MRYEYYEPTMRENSRIDRHRPIQLIRSYTCTVLYENNAEVASQSTTASSIFHSVAIQIYFFFGLVFVVLCISYLYL